MPDTPQPPAADREFAAAAKTVPIRRTDPAAPAGRRPAAEPPPPLVVCEHCGATADGSAPGWLVPRCEAGAPASGFGACPACLAGLFLSVTGGPPPRPPARPK